MINIFLIMGNFQLYFVDEIDNCDPGGWVYVDFRVADKVGFLVGKKIQTGKCYDLQKN